MIAGSLYTGMESSRLCTKLITDRMFNHLTSLKSWLTRPRTLPLPLGHLVILGIILVLALDLRMQSVLLTEVDAPIRADAKDHFFYAYNLRHFGTYSRSITVPYSSLDKPTPDAMRTPAYPLFVSLFITADTAQLSLKSLLVTQALISTLTVFVAFAMFRTFLTPSLTLAATFLTAISPHLVTMNIYVLTETLFCFLVVTTCWAIARAGNNRLWPFVVSGLLLAISSLTRPAVQYFIVPWLAYLIWHFRDRQPLRRGVLVLFSFSLIFGIWTIRNLYTLGTTGDDTLMVGTLQHGAYPGFMYNDDPKTLGYPYRFDPKTPQINKSLAAVTEEIQHRFREEPAKYLRWYLFGKPIALWSWNMVEGMGDVFEYPVTSTPYDYLPQFQLTHKVMYALHWPLVLLAFAGCIIVWLPASLTRLSESQSFTARSISLLLIYFTLLHMVGAPYPRYSIPLRPFLYGMSMFTVATVATVMRTGHVSNVISSKENIQ